MSLSTENNAPEQEKSEIQLNLEILRSLPYFERLPIELTKALAYLSKRVNYKEGSVLLAQDESSDRAFYILCGKLEVVRREQDREIVLGEIGPESLVGALALAAEIKSLFSLRTKSPLSCIALNRADFWPTITQDPKATAFFMEALARRIITWEEHYITSGDHGDSLNLSTVGVSLI